MEFLRPFTDIERRFVVLSMTSAKINIPDAADALRQYRECISKKKAEETKKDKGKSKEVWPEEEEHVYLSSLKASPLKKRKKDFTGVDPSFKGKSIAAILTVYPSTVSMTTTLLSFQDLTNFLQKSNDFRSSIDEEFLKGKKTYEVFEGGILSTFRVNLIFSSFMACINNN
ncbi:hypothetical protein Ddye_023451 [Dipteronia dyeriana]|uniref:Uncharacterized protein n=1 Tax=Dipteronia dyeriana TaxID=168575 RepID=A0AAD9WT91_9ROSI|nr:hypothetical protein Ddye_023451 [Dipteronia dyeriana]